MGTTLSSNCVEFVLPRGNSLASFVSQRSPPGLVVTGAPAQPYSPHNNVTAYQLLTVLERTEPHRRVVEGRIPPATAATVPKFEYVSVDDIYRQFQFRSTEGVTRNQCTLENELNPCHERPSADVRKQHLNVDGIAEIDIGQALSDNVLQLDGNASAAVSKTKSPDGATDAEVRAPASNANRDSVELSLASKVIADAPYAQPAVVGNQTTGKYYAASNAAASSNR